MDDFDKLFMDEIRLLREELKKQSETLHSINLTLAVQAEQLTLHIKRTEIAEERLNLISNEINSRISPIEKHVDGVSFMLKLLGAAALVVTLSMGLINLYRQVYP